MSTSGCSCNNPPRPKTDHLKDGIQIEVTPTELKGVQSTATITFVPKDSGKSKKPILLAPYHLQISFPENTKLYLNSKQIKEEVKSGKKIKLEKLLGTQQISNTQGIKLTIVPAPSLQSLEIQLKLLDGEEQEIQKLAVSWKQDKNLSIIKINLGHNQISSKIIYSLENRANEPLADIRLRYTNVSSEEEEKKVVLNNQLSGIIPIAELAGGERMKNEWIAIDFKSVQKATFRFEVTDQQNRVLANIEEVFSRSVVESTAGRQAFREITEELKKDLKDVDMDKMRHLLDQPGIPLNQLTPHVKGGQYLCPITMVTRAVQQGNLEMVKLLVEKGADVDAKSPKAAGFLENMPIIEGVGALGMAARNGDKDMVHALLEAGANVNGVPGFSGPIHLAARYDNVPLLQEFLKSGELDVNKQDSQGRTVLHYLIGTYERFKEENHKKASVVLEIIKEMIKKGANINKQSMYSYAPLHFCYRASMELLELFLNLPNIQVNLQDQEGYTLLHHVVNEYFLEKDPVRLSGLSQKISLLIQHHARIDLKSKLWKERPKLKRINKEEKKMLKPQAGKSVLEIAEEAGNEELVRLLKTGK